MKKSLYISAAIVIVIITIVVAALLKGSASRINFNLSGDYIAAEQSIPIKKGVVIFSLPDKTGFLVKSETAKFSGIVQPWSEVVFIAASTSGEVKRLSDKECKLVVLMDGEMKIRVAYNPEYFNPLTDQVWTGIDVGGDFKPSSLKLVARNITDGDYQKGIPDLAELPKSKLDSDKSDSPTEFDKIFDRGVLVLRRALGTEPESEANQNFWEAKLPASEVEEIKERIVGAIGVGEEIASSLRANAKQ